MKEFLRFFQRKFEFILKNALTNREKSVILSNTETSRRDGRVDEGATLEMWCGATHRGFESLSLRHFFCLFTSKYSLIGKNGINPVCQIV